MNRSSHQNNENLTLYEGLPLQGFSEARLVGGFFKNISSEPEKFRDLFYNSPDE
jgi:hypothetical protein